MCKFCDNTSDFNIENERDLLCGHGLTTKMFIIKDGFNDDYCLQIVNDLTGEKINSVKIVSCPVCHRVLGTNYIAKDKENKSEADNFFSSLYNHGRDYSDSVSSTNDLVEEAWRAVPKYTEYCGSTCAGEDWRALPPTGIYAPTAYKAPEANHEYGSCSNDALMDLVNTAYKYMGDEIDREILE